MLPARRKPILALLGVAAAAAAGVPLYAIAAPPGTKAPDLRADPVEPNSEYGTTAMVYDDTEGLAEDRLLIRFDGFVTNVGNGPLEIRGNPQLAQSAAGGVKQYAWGPSQSSGLPNEPVATPPVTFETADGHDHFHLMNAMRYSLWNAERTAEVAPAQKVGFCLYDLEQAPGNRGPAPAPSEVYTGDVTEFCRTGEPGATSLRMGTSAGWRDIYGAYLAYQWVDVSDAAPGQYVVASEADPNNVIWEGETPDRETNLRAFGNFPVFVPGYVAQPITVGRTGAPQALTLAAREFGDAGRLRWRIVDPPDHGTLGTVANSGSVTYTPTPGYAGSDSFSYAAFDADSEFPSVGAQPVATVSLNGVQSTITISGAPSTLVAGTSAQLSAALGNATGGVTWSASAGAITPGGLYTAPSAPPPGGVVVVRATSTSVSGLVAEAGIRITPAPVSRPAPLPVPTTGVPAAGRKLLSRMVLVRNGGRVLVATLATGPRAGRVLVTMTIGRAGRARVRVLGRCGARVGARRTVSCKITVPRGYTLRNVRATATISFGGKVRAVRRAGVARG